MTKFKTNGLAKIRICRASHRTDHFHISCCQVLAENSPKAKLDDWLAFLLPIGLVSSFCCTIHMKENYWSKLDLYMHYAAINVLQTS